MFREDPSQYWMKSSAIAMQFSSCPGGSSASFWPVVVLVLQYGFGGVGASGLNRNWSHTPCSANCPVTSSLPPSFM